MMFTTNGGGLDEYFAEISSLELPKDMERLQEISRFYRYEYLAPNSHDGSIRVTNSSGK
jgi:hypothetical protein